MLYFSKKKKKNIIFSYRSFLNTDFKKEPAFPMESKL